MDADSICCYLTKLNGMQFPFLEEIYTESTKFNGDHPKAVCGAGDDALGPG